VFCGGRGKSGGLVEKGNAPTTKKFSYYKILTKKNCSGKEDEDKRRQKNGQTFSFFFKCVLFENIY
jgi:hypothetical protein